MWLDQGLDARDYEKHGKTSQFFLGAIFFSSLHLDTAATTFGTSGYLLLSTIPCDITLDTSFYVHIYAYSPPPFVRHRLTMYH
jgi:hypothetical protein